MSPQLVLLFRGQFLPRSMRRYSMRARTRASRTGIASLLLPFVFSRQIQAVPRSPGRLSARHPPIGCAPAPIPVVVRPRLPDPVPGVELEDGGGVGTMSYDTGRRRRSMMLHNPSRHRRCTGGNRAGGWVSDLYGHGEPGCRHRVPGHHDREPERHAGTPAGERDCLRAQRRPPTMGRSPTGLSPPQAG